MPKTPYTPTPVDAATGANVRALRQRRGETLRQTVEQSGFGKDASTLAATERGERLLTDLEATKLAAHFNTTADQIRAYPMPARSATEDVKLIVGGSWPIQTEQAWLGNDKPAAPPLFAVPDATDRPELQLRRAADNFEAAMKAEGRKPFDAERYELIDLDHPMTPDEYRAQVWVPYLEARYAAETA